MSELTCPYCGAINCPEEQEPISFLAHGQTCETCGKNFRQRSMTQIIYEAETEEDYRDFLNRSRELIAKDFLDCPGRIDQIDDELYSVVKRCRENMEVEE